MGYELFCLNEVIDKRLKEKLIWKDGSLDRYENRLGQLCICPKTSGWGTKQFS